MELYKKYKEAYPNKSDAEIIESLAWELKNKVETIHRLLNENQALRIHNVVGQSEQLCECYDSHEINEVEIVEICCRCKKPTT